MTASEQAVTRALDALGIPYTLVRHAPAYTMQDCEAVDARTDAAHCKNLFLCNRQRTRYYLLCLRADKRFCTALISRQLQEARLSFADEQALAAGGGLV